LISNAEHFPHPGTISQDQVAIMGLEGVAFLYGGSNRYYEQYWDLRLNEAGEHWRRLTERRAETYADKVPFVSLFAPNKSSCLPRLYPLFRPRRHTTVWNWLRELIPPDAGAVFVDALEGTAARAMWRDFDSHWSPRGALTAFNAILGAFGKPIISGVEATIGRTPRFGDLSERWRTLPLFAPDQEDLNWDVEAPTVWSDNGHGDSAGAHIGRHIEWRNPSAIHGERMVIIGNSMSGIGFDQNHLTWWAARAFKSVLFVHSPGIATDALEAYRPDLLVYQTVERFMCVFSHDDQSSAQLDQHYVSRRDAR
jgi:alginate O-acetyltransferase complex protein AlgJ